ncbi:MAG: aryl-sulfate sulfotransferase N-terminal domain-containing protein [bacterium]|nr:aryl-sulfate sulfotransferase N-terminal domain-containing protein [bacterium]
MRSKLGHVILSGLFVATLGATQHCGQRDVTVGGAPTDDGGAADAGPADAGPSDAGPADAGIGGLSISGLSAEPNVYNNLAFYVVFTTSAPATATITVLENGKPYQIVGPTSKMALDHRIAIIGLHAGTSYTASVRVSAADGSIATGKVGFTTGALPDDIPSLKIHALDAAGRQPGYTVIGAAKKSDLTGDLRTAFAIFFVLDREGRVVHYRQAPSPVMGGTFLTLRDGTILYGYDNGAKAKRLGWTGEITGTLDASIFGANFIDHGVESLPDGNWVVLANADTGQVDAQGNPVAGAFCIEVDRGMNVLRRHRLDAESGITVNSELRDVDYDPRDDSLVILMKDRIGKINRYTGGTVWMMRGDGGDFTFEGLDGFPSRMHGLSVLPDGNLLVFDNGETNGMTIITGARPLEIGYDFRGGGGSIARKAWSYESDPPYMSPVGGNTIRLPNGNTMFNEGSRVESTPWMHTSPRIVEVTSDSPPRVVFEVELEAVFNGDTLEKTYIIYQSGFFEDLYALMD